ncbi:MAG: sulfite exporter TauE/SafE family protein [Desulfovibrionaceae bacterium]|nr:sulfite exporter TauE/SafE family protein [Desulfovibrionaceae bacterium]MBF0514410.1 sulfite exporter TauE/SafE family protein [Desulfovibrionaceae bacterium]
MWVCALAADGQDPQPPGDALQAAPVMPVMPVAGESRLPVLMLDKTELQNGGTITVTGRAEPGEPVYLEVSSEQQVRASRFDSEPDKQTGVRPYILYMTHSLPAVYRIVLPSDRADVLAAIKKEGGAWSYSQALSNLGANAAYSVPAKSAIDRYQATFLGGVVGSRGEKLAAMDAVQNRQRSMQLVKARFLKPGKLFEPAVTMTPDGSFTAKIALGEGLAPGAYHIRAVGGKNEAFATADFENKIAFPVIYLSNAGTSLNLFYPFLLCLCISIFGVLMGAGGGFLLNPILLSIWPLPHTVVAGTVMPTVLFSQVSGIYNYSKIKFINWKLGLSLGAAALAGGFIGPKLTELITLDQYKFVFGWILVLLALLMFWQTTPAYLARNKKEQAVLKECKLRAQRAVKAKQEPVCDTGTKE